MDFSKLNLEFNNIQKKMELYDIQFNKVLLKIKQLEKEIKKMETKITQAKSLVDKSLYTFFIEIKKEQLAFLTDTFLNDSKVGE